MEQPRATPLSDPAALLGDGRALLLGEVVDPEGWRWDVQLKGSGRTPFSRAGDGKAAVGPMLREYVMGEAMAALGIPTTRALAVVATGAPVLRETELPGAVLTRVAASHIRVGTFQFFAARGDQAQVRKLADYTIARHYPQVAGAESPYVALFDAVIGRQARLIAQWMGVGFIHGVMNTDNMSILGLTLDYGPFQFLDGFDPGHICNHSDSSGRYAFNRQPNVAYWNLFCLAQALLPLVGDEDTAVAALESYKSVFPREYLARMAAKLGITEPVADDLPLVQDLLDLLASGRVDYPVFWRRLSDHVAGGPADPVTGQLAPIHYTGLREWEPTLREMPSEVRQYLPGITPEGRRAHTLTDLLHHVHGVKGIERIRFATSHPRYFSERLIDACADLPKV